jgi:predicted thioesterase
MVPLTLILPKLWGLGVDGVFWAEPVSNILSGLACSATLWVTVMPELRTHPAKGVDCGRIDRIEKTELRKLYCGNCIMETETEENRMGEVRMIAGKTAIMTATVNESNTARAVGSGSTDVFATPMMVALMECAACQALSDVLEVGQTSVGAEIRVSHTAASPLGSLVTATATVTSISGRKIEFAVTASDGVSEIGKGTHIRVIVDEAKFMAKAKERI